jgi:hypothetical protein
MEPLSQLWAADPEGAFVSLSLGQGWRLTPELLPGAIVGSAGRELLFAGGNIASAEELADRAARALDDWIALVGGEVVEVTALMAFGGLAIGPGNRLELPWGTAADANEFVEGVRPFADRAPSLVIESRIPATLRVGEPEGAFGYDEETLKRAVRSATLLPLAVMLGLERDNYVVADWLWQTVLVRK